LREFRQRVLFCPRSVFVFPLPPSSAEALPCSLPRPPPQSILVPGFPLCTDFFPRRLFTRPSLLTLPLFLLSGLFSLCGNPACPTGVPQYNAVRSSPTTLLPFFVLRGRPTTPLLVPLSAILGPTSAGCDHPFFRAYHPFPPPPSFLPSR